MRVRGSLWRTAALMAVVSCGVVGLTAAPAAAASAAPAGTGSQRIDHSNVGATHSPQLLAQFSGSGGGSTSTSSGTMSPATSTSTSPVIAGAAQGIDVASYQESGGIDWHKVYAAGKTFAAIKVTEGTYYANPYASADITAAKAAGLAVVSYAFAIPNGDGGSASPVTQADYAIAHGAGLHGNLPPIMLDIEYDPYYSQDGTNSCYGLSQSAMATWIRDFVNEVKTKTGKPPIIYAAQQWWSTCVGTQSANVTNAPLWVASADTTSPGTLPAAWTNWTYWQYGQTSSASTASPWQSPVPGISGTVDLDQANPSLLTFLDPGNQQSTVNTAPAPSPLQLQTSVTTGVSYAVTGGALPPGLSLSASGQITGTPVTVGAYPVTVTATSTTGTTGTATAAFTWYVHGTLALTNLGNRSTVAGSPVDFQVQWTDSPSEPPVVFTAAGLPPGLSIDSGGLITGWPDRPGTYHVSVRALDHLQAYASGSFTWTVSAAADRGPTGQVRLDLGGKCLNDVGNRSSNGTPADIWRCNTSSAQKWTYAQDATLRIHGKCLTAPSHVNWKVRLESCTGAPSRQWLLVYPRGVNPKAGGDPLGLVNPAKGWCLEDPHWSTSNGTRVVVGKCDGWRNEMWRLPAGHVASQIPNRCVDDNYNRTANGTWIVLRACRDIAAERWTAEFNGQVRVHGKCLSVAHSSTSPGAKVWLWHCFGGANQQWRLVPDAAGVELRNPHSGLCLTDPWNSRRWGIRLEISYCKSLPGQRWRVQ